MQIEVGHLINVTIRKIKRISKDKLSLYAKAAFQRDTTALNG